MDASKEAEVVNLAKKIVEKYSEQLNSANIIIDSPKITREKNDKGYSSELVINVSDDDGVFDILEFFIYHNNTLMAEIEEVESEINEFFQDLIDEKVKN